MPSQTPGKKHMEKLMRDNDRPVRPLRALVRDAVAETLSGEDFISARDVLDTFLDLFGNDVEHYQAEYFDAALMRLINRELKASVDSVQPEQATLFAGLPGDAAPQALCVLDEDRGFLWARTEIATLQTWKASLAVLGGNVVAAQQKLRDRERKIEFLEPLMDREDMTTIEALEMAARVEESLA